MAILFAFSRNLLFVFKKYAPFLLDKVLQNSSLVQDGYERTNIWRMNPETRSKHPAPFPLELSDKLVEYYSYENDIVCDPFMGSGTTGVSALNGERRFVGIELKKNYFKIAQERIG